VEPEGLDHEYLNTFVQPLPHYNIKPDGSTWVKSRRPFNWKLFEEEHFTGKADYGFLGKWYPGYAVLDADDVNYKFVEGVKGKLGLDDNNSFTFKSESADSYHVLFRPRYNGKPGTQKLLCDILEPFAENHGVEVFPKPNQTIRAPFGAHETILRPEMLGMSWKDYLWWFGKLDEYDMSQVPRSQTWLPLDAPSTGGRIPVYKQGEEFLVTGLTGPSQREEGQFKVLYYLWRKNVPMSTAIETTVEWLRRGHNGYSKEVNKGSWRQIRKHIQRQAWHIYSNYCLPDETHNGHHGFLTKDDIPEIFHTVGGSLPKVRFLFNLVKYMYPRRLRKSTPVHRDLLVGWSSTRTYQTRLQELEESGLIRRSNFYIVGERAREIIINWEFRHPSQAILRDDRAPDTLEETLLLAYEKEELRALLKSVDWKTPNISRFLKSIYGEPPQRMVDVFPMPST
jgi:hypothetical protein